MVHVETIEMGTATDQRKMCPSGAAAHVWIPVPLFALSHPL